MSMQVPHKSDNLIDEATLSYEFKTLDSLNGGKSVTSQFWSRPLYVGRSVQGCMLRRQDKVRDKGAVLPDMRAMVPDLTKETGGSYNETIYMHVISDLLLFTPFLCVSYDVIVGVSVKMACEEIDLSLYVPKVGFCKLWGEGIEFYAQKYEINIGRRSKSTALDVIVGQ